MARIQASFPRAPGRGPQGAPDGTLAQDRGRSSRRSRSPSPPAAPSRRAAARPASKAAGSSVTALQSALGISADGVYGPQTRAAVTPLPAQPGPRRRRHRRSCHARLARAVRQLGAVGLRRHLHGHDGRKHRAVERSPSASRAAIRPPSRRRASTAASTSSRARRGPSWAGRETRRPPPRPSRTAWRPSSTRPAAPSRGPSAARTSSSRTSGASPARPASAGSGPGRPPPRRWRGGPW